MCDKYALGPVFSRKKFYDIYDRESKVDMAKYNFVAAKGINNCGEEKNKFISLSRMFVYTVKSFYICNIVLQ
jgi:hypothetical protein